MSNLPARAAVLLCAALTLVAACGVDDPKREESAGLDPASTTVEFVFTDASVPPEHHRSFTLTVADGTGTVVVDAYGDEIDRDERPVDDEAVTELVEAFNSGDLDAAFDTEGADCDGGTSLELTLDDGDTRESTEVDDCGGGSRAADDLRAAVAGLLASFDIAELTDGRYVD